MKILTVRRPPRAAGDGTVGLRFSFLNYGAPAPTQFISAPAGVFCCNSVGAHTMHPSVLYHHTTALSHKAHHVIAPFMASRYPFVGAVAHLFPKNAIKMLSFSTSGKGNVVSLSVQIFAVAGNHIFIPSKGLFPVPCRRPVRVREKHRDPAGLYFACAPSGKMILFTKKKITMEMPPLSTVVPML